LIEEIILAAPHAGIVISFRLQEARNCADSVAALKALRSSVACCVLRPAHGEPNAACDRALRILGVGDCFETGDAEVDALCRLLRGNWSGGVLVFVQILLRLDTHCSGIDDGSFHSAQKPVGK
jgi:hypothetical protein